MTLSAHFGCGCEIDEMLVFGPVRTMAAQAVDGDIFVSRVNDLISERMR